MARTRISARRFSMSNKVQELLNVQSALRARKEGVHTVLGYAKNLQGRGT